MQLRDMPEQKPVGQFPAQIPRRVFQGGNRLGLPALIPAARDFDRGVARIGAHRDLCHLDIENPWIVHLKPDNLGKFFADRFGNP